MSHNNRPPIRCFEGNAQPYEPFWKFCNAAQPGGDAELDFYGVISEYSWMEDEITPKKFKDDLYKFGNGGPVTVKINSPGGDVFAASVISSIMSAYPGHITVRIDGCAASAAVLVALSGKTIRIMDSAYMMIHDPAVNVMFAALNIERLGKLRDDLKALKAGIVQSYARRTGQSEEKLARMMADETWMSAREAVDLGFADEIITGGQKHRMYNNHAFVNALQNYVNLPSGFLDDSDKSENAPGLETSEQVPAAPDPSKVERLRNYLKVYAPQKKGEMRP